MTDMSLRADERHVEGARDRGCGEGEAVDADFEIFQMLFGADAEALLFVDDEKAEIFEVRHLR